MKPYTRRISQAIDTIPPELQGTVDRKSTEEQRQIFLERIYADYAELQIQNEEVLERKWKIDADVFQSHHKEIHDILFGGNEEKEGDMGDWDTWEKVETIIKHCVYSRPADFATRRKLLQSYRDRIDILNQAVVSQRQGIVTYNKTLNSQLEELSGLKNLLVLKEREIRTLRNQNTTYTLQIKHAKREVARIRGTKMIVEEDELMKDFRILLEANKVLERDNAAMRARLHAKYGTAELNAIQLMQETEQKKEEARKNREMNRMKKKALAQDGRGGAIPFREGDPFGALAGPDFFKNRTFGDDSWSSSDSDDDSLGSLPRATGREKAKGDTATETKRVEDKKKNDGGAKDQISEVTGGETAKDDKQRQEGKPKDDIARRHGKESHRADAMGGAHGSAEEFSLERSGDIEGETAEERHERRRAIRRRIMKEEQEKEEEEANVRAFQGMREALNSDKKREELLSSNVPVSTILIRIKKSNMALKRRMELEVSNMMSHLDYDAALVGVGENFGSHSYAFGSGPFIPFTGFRTKEEQSVLEVLMPRQVEVAPPSLRGSSRVSEITIPNLVLDEDRSSGDAAALSINDPKSSSASPIKQLPPLPPPLPVESIDRPRSVMLRKMSTLSSARGLSPTSTERRFSLVQHGAQSKRVSFTSWQSEIKPNLVGLVSGGYSDQSRNESHTTFPVSTEKSWNSLKYGLLGIAQLSRAECLKREALHVFQLRQKISFQQKQLDHYILNRPSELSLTDSKVPKFLSTGFGSLSDLDEEDDDHGEGSPHKNAGYIMNDSGEDDDEAQESLRLEEARKKLESEQNRRDEEEARLNDELRRMARGEERESLDTSLQGFEGIDKGSTLPYRKGDGTDLNNRSSDRVDYSNELDNSSSERAFPKTLEGQDAKKGATGKKGRQGGVGMSDSSSPLSNGSPRDRRRGPKRSVMFREDPDAASRYGIALDTSDSANAKLNYRENALGSGIQGHRVKVGGRRHSWERRNSSSQDSGELSWSRRRSLKTDLSGIASRGGMQVMHSMRDELAGMRQMLSDIRKRQVELQEEIKELLKLLMGVFDSVDALVEEKLRMRLQAAGTGDGGIEGILRAMGLDFLDSATAARVRDFLLHECGIHLDGEGGDTGEERGRRASQGGEMGDEEWLAGRLRNIALQTAISRAREEYMDPFMTSDSFHYYVGPDGETEVRRKRKGSLRDGNDEVHRRDHQQRKAKKSERKNNQYWLDGGGDVGIRRFIDEILGAGSAMPYPLQGYDDENEAQVNPEHNTTSNDLLRVMLMAGLRGPQGANKNKRKSLDINRDAQDDVDEGGFDENGKLRRPFQRVVRGQKMGDPWNPEHPFASLFPALFYDQGTSMGGEWFRVPIGANAPTVDERFNDTPRTVASPPTDLRRAESHDILQFLRDLQPQYSRSTALLRPIVYHYDIPSAITEEQRRVRERLQHSLEGLYADDFTAFLRRYVLPIASAAKQVASSNHRLDPPLLAAIRQLRQEEERRRQHRVALLFRRVATNIRSRHMLRQPIYQGGAFLGYIGMMYTRWRERMEREEEAWRDRQDELNDSILQVMHLDPRPTQERSSMRSRMPIHPPAREAERMDDSKYRGHFQNEKSSFHFERAELPFDEKKTLSPGRHR